MTVDIVIPVQEHSASLDNAVNCLERFTSNYNLIIVREPSLNVSEARQLALDTLVKNRYVCFLDDDSEMDSEGWLDEMLALVSRENTVAAFQIERWGDGEYVPAMLDEEGDGLAYGPAACMLLDTQKIPKAVKWNCNIGLRSGWLGGDFEEVDYCYQLRHCGLKLARTTTAKFNHKGGKTTMDAFAHTDRARAIGVMRLLLEYKWRRSPLDNDWFSGIKYVKADPANDCMLGRGSSIRDCYHDVIVRNGLERHPTFKRLGLV